MMEGVDDRGVDITRMDLYPEGRFDAFICSHVLEHVPDDRKAMAELFRVLKPGGWGITMVPIEIGRPDVDEECGPLPESERWRRFGQDDHVRMYSQEGFLSRLRGAGFAMELLRAADLGGARLFARCGLAPESVLYLAHKPAGAPPA